MPNRKDRRENWSKIQPMEYPKAPEDGYDFFPPFKEVDFFIGEVDQICKDHGYYINVVSFLCPTQFFLQRRDNQNENYYVRFRGHNWSVVQTNEESFSSGELVTFSEVKEEKELQIGKVSELQPMVTIAAGNWINGVRTLEDVLIVINVNRFN